MGHFDISGIWDLLINWKISSGLFVTWDNWRKFEEIHQNRPPQNSLWHLDTSVIPKDTPKHPSTPNIISYVPQEWPWPLSCTRQTAWESEGMNFHQIPSMMTNVFKLLISPMRLPSKSEGHRYLKYQNVPYIPNFWHIGKPWEGFKCWVRRIYFLTVPNDHTVVPNFI